jgi:hypothetical protein
LRKILPETYREAVVPWKVKLLLNVGLSTYFFFAVSHTTVNLPTCLLVTTLSCVALALSNWFLFAEDRAMLAKIVLHFSRKSGTGVAKKTLRG